MPPAGGTVTVDLALVASVVSVPTSLRDANGSFWQVTSRPRSSGPRASGPATARPACRWPGTGSRWPSLGSCPASGSCFVASEENKRELVFEQDGLHGLHVTRKVFIPVDGYFVRILDLITNPSAADSVTVDLVHEAKLGSSFVRASSTGDTSATVADQWLALDDGATSDIWTQPFPTSEFGPSVLAAWGAERQGP